MTSAEQQQFNFATELMTGGGKVNNGELSSASLNCCGGGFFQCPMEFTIGFLEL